MDNYINDYRPYYLIYTHPSTTHSIYLGDLQAATNLNYIHSHKINTVITAALGMDQLDYSQIDVKHVLYPLLDNKIQNISEFFNRLFEIVERNIRFGSILIHCSAGTSRSPTLLAAYLMRKQDLKYKQAVNYLQSKGKKLKLNLGAHKQLKTYELYLQNNSNTLNIRANKNVYFQIKKQQHPRKFIIPLSHQSNSTILAHSKHLSLQDFLLTNRKRQGIMTHRINRPKLSTIDSKRSQILFSSLGKRSQMEKTCEQQHNNFEVKRMPINQRATYRKKSRSRPIVLPFD